MSEFLRIQLQTIVTTTWLKCYEYLSFAEIADLFVAIESAPLLLNCQSQLEHDGETRFATA